MNTTQHIAQTIISQIESQVDGGSLLAVISKQDYVALDENDTRQGGLTFSLKKGGNKKLVKLLIELSWSDDYTVSLHVLDRKTLEGGKTKEIKGIYCDMLADCVLTQYEAAA